ncbi:MAG: LexA family transcriptional regulator [Rikenellaceae bacterium]
MDNLKHQILSKLQEYKKFNKKADFARFLSVEPQVLSNWYKRNTFDINIIVDKFPEINKGWLLSGEGEMLKSDKKISNSTGIPDTIVDDSDNSQNNQDNYIYVPLLPISAQGGTLNDFVVYVKAEECEQIISPIKGVDFAMSVNGDSMTPDYPSGSQILIKRINERAFIEWGKVYVLDTCNGSVIKKIMPSETEDKIKCLSINTEYPSFDIHKDDIYGVYRVVMCMSMK